MSNSERTIYHQCKCCSNIFRQSDTVTWDSDSVRPKLDWLEKINRELYNLELKEAAAKANIKKIKENATIAGRESAVEHIGTYDSIFNTIGYNPDDAKVQFNPVDYIIFNGMNTSGLKNIVLLDHAKNGNSIQESIRYCIENELYKFITLKIDSDGQIIEQ